MYLYDRLCTLFNYILDSVIYRGETGIPKSELFDHVTLVCPVFKVPTDIVPT